MLVSQSAFTLGHHHWDTLQQRHSWKNQEPGHGLQVLLCRRRT